MNSKRIVILSALALVAAPALAGCMDGGNQGGDKVDLTLKMGTMMPLTGALADLGEDMQNGAKLAAKQINDANVGLKVEQIHADDGTTKAADAPNTFQQLVSQGATVVAGPCCSGVSQAILDKAIENKVVSASPSATSPSLTDRDNQGYFWRVSPSDAVQGKVLANLVAGDGVKTVHLIVVNNAYGNGLASVFQQTFTTSLSGAVLGTEKINEESGGTSDVSSQVTAACAAAGVRVTGVVLVMYIDQGAAVLKEMSKQGCLGKVKLYGSEGVYKGDGPEGLPAKAGQDSSGKWLAAGMKGTNPESGDLSRFNSMFKNEYGHDAAQYSAESYDAVMYLALAALKAKSVKGEDIARELPSIANPAGVKCQDFATCANALLNGDDIDYQGQAHDFEFDETKREPTRGIYSWWAVDEAGKVSTIATGKTA